MTSLVWRVTLTKDEYRHLMRPISGSPDNWGGWQRFAYTMQQQVIGNVLTLSDLQLRRVERYATGKGTWQNYMYAIQRAVGREASISKVT